MENNTSRFYSNFKEYVGISKLSDEAKLAADTNKDGKITPADSTLILRAYVGLNNISI